MKIDVRSLVAEEKQLLPFSYSLCLPEADSTDFGGIWLTGEAQVEGNVIGVAGCLRVEARVSVGYNARCARCLTDVSGTHTFSFERHIVPAGQFAGLDEDASDAYLPIEDGRIDMDESILEALILSLPLRVLCDADCKGLCARCGKNLNHGDCNCTETEIDPRMAPLAELLARMKAEEEENG